MRPPCSRASLRIARSTKVRPEQRASLPHCVRLHTKFGLKDLQGFPNHLPVRDAARCLRTAKGETDSRKNVLKRSSSHSKTEAVLKGPIPRGQQHLMVILLTIRVVVVTFTLHIAVSATTYPGW